MSSMRFSLSSACLALCFCVVFAGVAVRAQEAIPLSGETTIDLESRNDAFWLKGSARRALESGFYDVALGLAEQLIASGVDLSEDERSGILMLMVDANLGLGFYDEAERLVAQLPEGGSSELRNALVAFGRGASLDSYADLLDREDEFLEERGERVWLWVLRGWRAARSGKIDDSLDAFGKARGLAELESSVLLGQVDYIRFRSRLIGRGRGPASVEELRRAIADAEGKEVGYRYAQLLAIALEDRGEVDEAVTLLANRLAIIPGEFDRISEELMLLQVVIAGIDRPEGRQAMRALVLERPGARFARVALQRAVETGLGDDIARRVFLRALLDDSVAAKPDHPLLDEVLYYRAVLRLQEGNMEGVEDDAELLESKFATSPYRRGVLSVLALMDWQRGNFRTAASHLSLLRNDFSAEFELAGISSIIADCYFRAGVRDGSVEDFVNASEAYEVALTELAFGEGYDRTVFQLVSSYLGANEIAEAQRVLDDPEIGGRIAGLVLWRAEWSFVKKLRATGMFEAAYERAQSVLRLVDGELKLRFIWLSSKLSLETGHSEETANWLASLDDFIGDIAEGSIERGLLDEVRASVLLSYAEAQFAVGDPEKAMESLEDLRENYGEYEAALFSYIIQARYFSSVNRTVDAQQRLVFLADNYAESRLAPMALFEAALNAEKRGQGNYLDQANQLLERISRDYPNSDIVYYSRLKQADLLRKLNQFGAAQQLYESLENRYSDRHDRYLAQISLADTLMARSVEDPAKFDAAISRFELLVDLSDVPTDLRVEAGYKLGVAWQNSGNLGKAKQALWTLYDLILGERDRMDSLGVKGRYWLARSLFTLAELEKSDGDLDRARFFYEIIVRSKLSGFELAKDQLGRIESGTAN